MIDDTTNFFAFGGAAGGGKIVANEGVVLTPFGWKKGKDLKVGQLINNPDGTIQRIIQVHPEVSLEKWEVIFSDGTSTEVASDHLWNAWKGRKGRKIANKRTFGEASAEVVETKEMAEWIKRGYKPQIPVCSPQPFNIVSGEKSKINPYLLGVLLGDGCITPTNNTITCDEKDKDHYRKILGNVDITYISHNTIRFVGEKNRLLNKKLELHGLNRLKSKNKFIPKAYKYSSVKDRLDIVNGLMDTDGWSAKNKNACYYDTISPHLANDMAFILRSLGAVVTITKGIGAYKKNGVKIICNDVYHLYIKYANPDGLFKLKRKKHGIFGKNIVQKSVSEIRVGGTITGRCITVSNPNGLYITNDFIVTHNSWAGCVWLMMNSLTYDRTRWFIGREELKRLSDSTLETFFKVSAHYGLGNEWKFNGQRNYIKFHNGSRIDLLELKYLPRDPMYERYGSTEYTGGWIEEGGEVHFDAYDTLKSRIGRQLNNHHGLIKKILITCNPKKNWLYTYFYKPWTQDKLPDHMAFLQSLVTDNPKIEKGYLESLNNIQNEAKKQRLRYGNWEYDDDPSALIDWDSIQDFFTNEHVAPTYKKYLTADIAMQGSDRFVIAIWNGWVIEYVHIIPRSDGQEVLQMILDMSRKYGVPRSQIAFDNDGIGSYLGGFLKGAYAFINGGKPVYNVRKKEADKYRNLKTQCYFHFAKKVRDKESYMKFGLPPDIREELETEMSWIKNKSIDTDNVLEILKKEDIKEGIGRSPDLTDALMMRSVFDLKKQKRGVKTR